MGISVLASVEPMAKEAKGASRSELERGSIREMISRPKLQNNGATSGVPRPT